MGYMHYTPSVTFLMQDIPEMVIWMDGSSTISSSLSENYKYFEPRWDPFQHILQMRSILKSCLDHGSSWFLMKMKNRVANNSELKCAQKCAHPNFSKKRTNAHIFWPKGAQKCAHQKFWLKVHNSISRLKNVFF